MCLLSISSLGEVITPLMPLNGKLWDESSGKVIPVTTSRLISFGVLLGHEV